MEIVSGQHDRFFRALLEEPGVAGALLRERLPREVVEALDLSEPELIEGTFVDEQLRASQTDRLYRVRRREGGAGYVYCLVEHKSAPDRRVALQLLRYMARIWERVEREVGSADPLPPIVPLVVYHGTEPWNAGKRFGEIVAAPEPMKRNLLDFPFTVFDLGKVPAARLSENTELLVGLVVLKYAMREGPGGGERRAELVLRYVSRLPSGPLVRQIIRYMGRSYRTLTRRQFEQAVEVAMPQRKDEMVSIAAEEWMAEGRAKGRAEGRVEGRVEGERRALVRVLERRFGPLPPEVRERIERAPEQRLESLVDRAVDAPTLDAVFEGSPH